MKAEFDAYDKVFLAAGKRTIEAVGIPSRLGGGRLGGNTTNLARFGLARYIHRAAQVMRLSVPRRYPAGTCRTA
jgi:hypothetical protein